MTTPAQPSGFIYGLCCPRSGELRYVGCTVQPLADRFYMHVYDATRTDTATRCPSAKAGWVRELSFEGLSPEIFEIEVVPVEEMADAEVFWIRYFRSIGCELFNVRCVRTSRFAQMKLRKQQLEQIRQRNKELPPESRQPLRRMWHKIRTAAASSNC